MYFNLFILSRERPSQETKLLEGGLFGSCLLKDIGMGKIQPSHQLDVPSIRRGNPGRQDQSEQASVHVTHARLTTQDL